MNAFECPFSYHGRKNPKQIALINGQTTWDYKTCHQVIETLAAALKQQGVKSGDRVAVYPTLEFPSPLLFFALFRLGAICCPLNTYSPLNQLTQTLDALTATYFLYPEALQKKLPQMKQITHSFETLLKNAPSPSTDSYFLDKDAHATYLMTSGTTQAPKIACHSLGNHYYSALGSNAYLPIQPGDRWLLSLPLYHVAGIALLFRTFLAGATVVFPEGKAHEIATVLRAKASHVSFIPTQLQRFLDSASDIDLLKVQHQLKSILIGGASIDASLVQTCRERGLPVFPSYGMTEMSSQICTQFTTDCSAFSLGHPLPYREIAIDAEQEIHVRGKTLFLGYLNEHKSLTLPLDADGYFATGDLGIYSPKSGLQIHGRKDRLFISGGENIYPEEIETYLKQVEGMIDVRIEPKQDQEFGMRPVAFIQSSKSYHQEELQDYLESYLPKFKIPIAFYPLEEEPSKGLKSQL
ncbi:o-succinylbenzoate--CoA ligase [Simkania sp.]|uniref:o-succinylbenzoate--CoA ligase n=1 Tax=Simkania sp. TaxID=34094 RepID=UPI003B5171F7